MPACGFFARIRQTNRACPVVQQSQYGAPSPSYGSHPPPPQPPQQQYGYGGAPGQQLHYPPYGSGGSAYDTAPPPPSQNNYHDRYGDAGAQHNPYGQVCFDNQINHICVPLHKQPPQQQQHPLFVHITIATATQAQPS